MITKQVIDEIYKKYKKNPESTDDLNIALLFEAISPDHSIEIEGNDLIINSINPMSPFHMIPLHAVHAIIEFDAHVAIVLHSSIIFLNKDDNGVSVHIKKVKPSLLHRLTDMLTGARALACLL